MTSLVHARLHQDHRSWESEIHCWRDDVALWQQELTRARSQIKELEAALSAHETTLREHAASLRLDELKSDEHEHALADYERGGSGAELSGLMQSHHEEAQRQASHRHLHEQLKCRHNRLLANWQLLLQSLVDSAKR